MTNDLFEKGMKAKDKNQALLSIVKSATANSYIVVCYCTSYPMRLQGSEH